LRQQVLYLGVLCVIDIVDDVCKPFVGINIIFGAGSKEAVEHSYIFCGIV
jgi:hypothetical protein